MASTFFFHYEDQICRIVSFALSSSFSYLSSLCLYFMRTVPVLTSMIQMELPPQVATLDVVLSGECGSGSNTTSQIWVWMSAGSLFLLRERMKCIGS